MILQINLFINDVKWNTKYRLLFSHFLIPRKTFLHLIKVYSFFEKLEFRMYLWRPSFQKELYYKPERHQMESLSLLISQWPSLNQSHGSVGLSHKYIFLFIKVAKKNAGESRLHWNFVISSLEIMYTSWTGLNRYCRIHCQILKLFLKVAFCITT